MNLEIALNVLHGTFNSLVEEIENPTEVMIDYIKEINSQIEGLKMYVGN